MSQPKVCHKTETNGLIALGSNVTFKSYHPLDRLRQSLKDLQRHGILIRKVSGFYSTPFFPPGTQNDVVNAVARITWTGSAADVLAILHSVEAEHGRERDTRWGDRTLDLDLLDWGGVVAPDPDSFDYWQSMSPENQAENTPQQMILPHPRIQDRAFVLVPLLDVAPDWQHPVTGQSAAQMLEMLPERDKSDIKRLDK